VKKVVLNEILREEKKDFLDKLPERSDKRSTLEAKVFEDDKLRLEVKRYQFELDELHQNMAERKGYARKLFVMLCAWLAIMLGITIFNGIVKLASGDYVFRLSDTILVTLITTTTANVAAFFLVVTRYLFPVRK